MATATVTSFWIVSILLAVMRPVSVELQLLHGRSSCDFINHLSTYKCRNIYNMSSIRVYVNSHKQIKVLDISNNNIHVLAKEIFLLRGFTKVNRLHMSNSGVELIDPQAFSGLMFLGEVDLSNNALYSLNPETFKDNPRLWYLNLRNNPLSTIPQEPTFLNVPSLKFLDISMCKFHSLTVSSFLNLKDLVHLNLSGNLLTVVSHRTFLPLHQLRVLDLSRNPWNCVCMLQSLRDWYVQHYPSSQDSVFCSAPKCLEGRSWAEESSFCNGATAVSFASRSKREVNTEDPLWAGLPYPGCKGPEPTREFPWVLVIGIVVVCLLLVIVALILYRTCRQKHVTRSFWVRDRDTAPLTTENFINHRQNSIMPFGIIDDVATFQRNSCDYPPPYSTDIPPVTVKDDVAFSKDMTSVSKHTQTTTSQQHFLRRTPLYEILHSTSDNQSRDICGTVEKRDIRNGDLEKQQCLY